jgi:hypothetical protein
MGTGTKINIANGMPGKQIYISQFASKITSEANEERIKKELDIDFFVAPNGKALPKEFEHWIGSSRRIALQGKAKNPRLQNVINQLYRPGAIIGDGGTASVIKFEKRTGIGLGKNGNSHIQKGKEMIRYIERKVLPQKDLSPSDRKLAQKLAKSLKKAVWGN